MAVPHPTEEERLALCQWLTANGVSPNTVPLESHFAIVEEPDGRRLIHYMEFVRDEKTGNILVDPDDRSPMKRTASVPCKQDPPAWLNLPGGRP